MENFILIQQSNKLCDSDILADQMRFSVAGVPPRIRFGCRGGGLSRFRSVMQVIGVAFDGPVINQQLANLTAVI